MIIYYKLPSYPTATCTLPFANISAKRKKHLVKYYNLVNRTPFENEVSAEKLQRLLRNKTLAKYWEIDRTLEKASYYNERNREINTLKKEASQYCNSAVRVVQSSGRTPQWVFQGEAVHHDCVANTLPADTKIFSEQSNVIDTGEETDLKKTKMARLVRCPVYITSLKLRKVSEKRENVHTTRKKTKNTIDEVTSVNKSNSKATLLSCQTHNEKTNETETPERTMDQSPDKNTIFSQSRRKKQPKLQNIHRSHTRTSQRTFTFPSNGSKSTSISGCSPWSPDDCNSVVVTVARKRILKLSSAKRRALMGVNLPIINEENYLSCPAIQNCKVSSSPENSSDLN